MIILYWILYAKMVALHKLLYRKRFQTAYDYRRLHIKRQEEALIKFFCMKERLRPHMKKVCRIFLMNAAFGKGKVK